MGNVQGLDVLHALMRQQTRHCVRTVAGALPRKVRVRPACLPELLLQSVHACYEQSHTWLPCRLPHRSCHGLYALSRCTTVWMGRAAVVTPLGQNDCRCGGVDRVPGTPQLQHGGRW